MRFILSTKCTDGVVLIADRKVILFAKDGLNFEYRKKLFAELRHLVFGSSGSTGDYELFRSRVQSHIRKNNILIDDIINVLSDIAFKLK
jgi:20S proteasome alpha/beta subunit